LEGVGDVPWNALTHAYGPASDVPELLTALASSDAAARERAIHELFGTIWHQGTVYEATAHAVPFLAGIAADPDVRDRASVVRLLAAIAEGAGYLEVHRSFIDPEEADRDLDTNERAEATWVKSAREAVRAQMPTLLRLLEDQDVDVRRMAPSAIARGAAGDQGEADDVLIDHLSREPDGLAAAATVMALDQLGVTPGHRVAQAVSQGPAAGDPSVGFALGLMRARSARSEHEINSAVDELAASAGAGKVEAEALAWDEDGGAIGLLLAPFNDRPGPATRLMALLSLGHDDELALAATYAIGDLIREWRSITPAGVSALASVLDHTDGRRVESAVAELERVAPACRPAADQVATLVERATGIAFERAVVTLARLRDPRAYPHVESAIRATDVPDWGPEALLHLGPHGQALLPVALDAVDRLRGMPEHRGSALDNRKNAMLSWIGTLGDSAEPAVPVLATFADSGDLAAASALASLGRAAADARDTLARIAGEPLRDSEERVRDVEPVSVSAQWLREHAAIAMWRIDGDPEPMLRVAREALPSGDLLCLEYLEDLGHSAEPLLVPVREQFGSSDDWNRLRAARVIYRITDDPELVATAASDLVAPTPVGILAIETLAELGGPVRDETRERMEEWRGSDRRLGGGGTVLTFDDAVERDERFRSAMNDALGV
jgi:hypothetical protein